MSSKLTDRSAAQLDGRNAMLKDAHLLDAALLTDGIVLSMDEKSRRLFSQSLNHMPEISSVCWGNPTREAEQLIEWVDRGAPNEESRQLARHPNSNHR